MKRCPACKKLYSDPSLNFCLDDGTPLEGAVDPGAETMVMGTARPTSMPSAASPTSPPSWAVAQPHQLPAKKASRVLPWIAGILALVLVVCGGGFAGIMYLGSRAPKPDTSRNSRSTSPVPEKTTTAETGDDVTKAQFESIKIGADRKEVEKIMGGSGDEYYSGTGGGISFTSVKWVGQKYRTILVSFRDNKVTSKSQVGLDK